MQEIRGQRVSDLPSVMQSCMAWMMCACAKMKSCCSREPFAMFAKKHAVCSSAVLVKIAKRNKVENYMMGHIFVGGF